MNSTTDYCFAPETLIEFVISVPLRLGDLDEVMR